MVTQKRPPWANPRWAGAFFYFGLWAVIGSYAPFLNVYLSRLGFSGFQIGLIAVTFPLMTIVAGPFFSMLADRRRIQKPVLLLSLGSSAVVLLAFLVVRTFAGILLLALLRAVLLSPLMPIADGLVARMAVRHRIDYGKLRLWGSLSFALTAIGGGAVWDALGFPAMFITAVVLILPVMALTLWLETPTATTDRRAAPPLQHLWRDRGLIALLIAYFLIGIAEGMYGTFSSIQMDTLGGGQVWVGALFGFSALCELPVMQYSSAIFRRLGKPRAILLAYSLVGLSLLGYALARAPWLLLGFAMLKGMGFALYFVGNVSLIDERAPDAWTSTLQSLMNAASRGLAPLLTVPLAGWFGDALGLPAVFASAGGAALLAAGVIGAAVIRNNFSDAPLLSE
ncbi:MAG TPA: MFS transporter [Anaerolineae bacterium]|nr:MFS transporter [Anaerolineae bacterium]